MRDYYYEVTITPSSHKEEIESFLMDHFYNGIEEVGNSLILRSEEPLEDIIEKTKEYANALSKIFSEKVELDIKIEKKENQDWIENYKKSITPVEVEEFYIRPSWYEKKETKIDIVMDPALAFGSGHHPSTLNCLKIVSQKVKKEDKVLDVGTGSGILAIAAAKKGAIVDICDTDELAVKEAKKNFRLNKVEFNKAWIGSAVNLKEKYDIVIVNIVADVLVFLAKDLKSCVKDGGYLILSGIVEKYLSNVLERYNDLKLIKKIQEKEWITLLLAK
ncbi:50S ribosomal protein L11 methyltransferase [Nitrosophilus labii]|uniref:50S ribosomal protein L11 methyltransferase n=1 Tax=Nitrosophilus labii TaxID=2706014 RepID=UPI0016571497|nr:50S ribosomal protein L11 methyltransferase [Nitrosophilus labii]